MDELTLKEVRAYMDATMKLMDSIFSHFTLTIGVTGDSDPDAGDLFVETDLLLELWPEHHLSTREAFTYIQKNGLGSTGVGYTIEKFPLNGLYSEAFKEAQQAGRKIYYALRDTYPIRRKLNWTF